MFRKPLVVALTVLLLNLLSVAPVTASTGTEEEVRFSEKVKGEIVKLGTGPEARIEVRLRDKTKLKGYVRESDETQFVIVDAKTGVETTVPYPQVQKVKGNNLATGVKIAIGIGIAIVVLSIFCVLYKPCASS
jgi:hypothetical protein